MTLATLLPTFAAPTLAVQREALSDDLWSELHPLIKDHWAEVAPCHSLDIPVCPNRGHYTALAEAGLLQVYTARIDGRLVGYLAVIVCEHQNHKSLQADVCAVYVSREARGKAGAKFLRHVDAVLAHDGVEVVRHRVKGGRDWSPLLERMGYIPEEVTWSRRLR